jgi:hypothetical protein
MLVGALIFVVARRFAAIAGAVPEGDLLVLAERQNSRLDKLLTAVDGLDVVLRRWLPAGMVLLASAILLGASFLLFA